MNIMKSIFVSWRQNLLLLLLFATIATALLASLASNTYIPQITDIANHIAAIAQAKMALAEGQFPLRVAPLEQEGWRYPFYQFYSTSSYTLAGLISQWLNISNPFIAYKLTIWCALVAGGIYMYRLAFWFVESYPAAILASIAYLTAPYYSIVINHMGGFNEAIALGILPAVLYYTLQRYYHRTTDTFLLQAGLAWYLLATVHLITFFYTSLFVATLLICLTYRNLKHWKNLISAAIAYAFGCFLAMWYLAPIALLAKYFVVARTFDNRTFVIDAHAPFLSSLLSPAANITNGGADLSSIIHPALGMPMLMAIGICIYAFATKSITAKERPTWLIPLLILFFVAFVMAWTPINFWQWLPRPFTMIQYSWRLLAQAIWPGALLLAWAISWLFQYKLDARHTVIGILLIILATSDWLPISEHPFVTFSDVIQHPTLVSEPNSYLINTNKYPQFINIIDEISLDPSLNQDPTKQYFLKLHSPNLISRSLFDTAVAPYVSLKGRVPDDKNLNHQQLAALIDGNLIATHELKPGELNWNIPLTRVHKPKKLFPLALQFEIYNAKKERVINSKLNISIEKIMLGGFLNPTTTLGVDQVKQHCQQQKEETVCKIDVPTSTHLIELPILYYPGLLNISVNGKVVSYKRVLRQDRLIAGIIPEPGKTNIISIEFRGLLWANFVSQLSWGIWLLFALFITLKTLFPPEKSSTIIKK